MDIHFNTLYMDSYTDDVSFLSEARTRKKYIDPILKKSGWISKYIKEEVNPVKSDFKNKNFIFFKGQIERNVDKFIDYLLLDEDYTPLAIIEAKRFSKAYAGVSTGILIFTKGEPTENVWFYDMEADGYSLDDKRTFIDVKGDIPDIIEKYNNKENQV